MNKRLADGFAVWTFSVLCNADLDLFSHMEGNKGPADGSVAWALLVLCSLDLFGPTKWSEELTENLHFGLVRSYRREWKGLQMTLQLGLFQSAAVWAFVQSYEVEWKTCRVELQLGFVQPCTRE